MEDRDADLSPCNFATTRCPAERSSFISLQFRDHPFDSLNSVVLSPLNFATHETQDPFATPQKPQKILRVCFLTLVDVSDISIFFRSGLGEKGGGLRRWPGGRS